MSNKTTLKEFAEQALKININDLEENQIVDVEHLGIQILSYNPKEDKNEYNIVKALVRKEDDYKYIINDILECSKGHRLYIRRGIGLEPYYSTIGDILELCYPFYIKSYDNEWAVGSIKKTKKKIKIYDLQINNVENFYSSGLLSHNSYNPLVEPGGEAWKYLQSLKIEISKSVDKDDNGTYGIVVKGKITKSKVCIPFRTFEYYVLFGKGILRIQEIIDLSISMGLIVKGGAWYTITPEVKVQGEESVKKFLMDNPEFCMELEKKILKK